MADKLRLLTTASRVIELGVGDVPVTRIGGRGTKIALGQVKHGGGSKPERVAEVLRSHIYLVDWDEVEAAERAAEAALRKRGEGTKEQIQSLTHAMLHPQPADGPTRFFVCLSCGLMVERAEGEAMPQDGEECEHEWQDVDVD